MHEFPFSLSFETALEPCVSSRGKGVDGAVRPISDINKTRIRFYTRAPGGYKIEAIIANGSKVHD